jgi:hypothetical protein
MSSKSLFSNSSASIHWAGDLASGVSFGYVIDDGLVKLINPAGGKLNVLENCAQFEALAPSVIHKAQYYCISDNKRDGSALVELNLSDGKESQVLFAKPGCSVERVFLSAKDHRPVMVWYRGKENGFQLVDKTYSSLMEAIKSKIKGADKLQLTGCSSDENVWIVLQEFSDGRKIYYRYNVANKDIRQLNTVDTSYELKRAKIMMQTVPDTRGKELVLRFYSPPVEEIKYPAILVFGERMWSLNSSAHDSLLMALSLRGFPILEVDLLHSQSYGATALLNGYSWWSNMVVSDVPVMIAAINKMFPKIPGVVPCGFGIGAEMAMHTMSLHPDLKMRSVLIQPFFDAGVYANYLQKHGDDDLRFIVKGTEKPDETPAAHLGSAMNPMIIYSTVDTELAEILNPVIHSLSLSGNAPAIMNYSDDAGLMSSAQTLAQAVTEITQYIGAVPVRKTK